MKCSQELSCSAGSLIILVLIVICGASCKSSDSPSAGGFTSYKIPAKATKKTKPYPPLSEPLWTTAAEYWLAGEKVGERGWYKDGTLCFESPFKNGRPHGEVRLWYEDGSLRERTVYNFGETVGTIKEWHRNKQLKSETHKKNGKLHGLRRFYSDNGKLIVEQSYSMGLPNGTFKRWDKIGKLLGSYEMKSGNGEEKMWREDGTLWTTTPRLNGKVHGICKSWDKEGKEGRRYYIHDKPVSKDEFLRSMAADEPKGEEAR